MELIDGIEDTRDFATIYKKDYLGKQDRRARKYKLLPKYSASNILNRPYKQYLNTRLENQSLSENERSEDPVDNLNRMRDKFPRLKKVLPEIVPDENVIVREKKKSMKTTYQLDYLKEIDYYREEITLPQGWIIPETIQKRTYRNPWVIATKELIKSSKIFKPSSLGPDPKEREILRITTGNSEYTSTIGIVGERIKLRSLDMKDHIGLQNSLKSPQTSECSLILKQNLALPSKIF